VGGSPESGRTAGRGRLGEVVRHHRVLAGLVVAATVFATVFAFATALGVGTGTLQAGSDTTVADFKCDTDGVKTTYNTTFSSGTYVVSSVSVDNLGGDSTTYNGNNPCNGKKLAVTLVSGSTVVGSGNTTISLTGNGHSQSVAVTAAPSQSLAVSGVDGVHVVINDGTTS
jgi:hypothetical protein